MTTLILATRNQHKVQEIREILGTGFKFLTLDDFENAPEVVEDGDTFAKNASKKSQELAQWIESDEARLGKVISGKEEAYVMADDSGLEVGALEGAPGVYSARFAADETGSAGNSSDEANNAKLLRLLSDVSQEKRSARFRCVIALTQLAGDDSLKQRTFDGTCEGQIALTLSGAAGFGYDPLFVPNGYSATFAELGEVEKNKISHRSEALRILSGEWGNIL